MANYAEGVSQRAAGSWFICAYLEETKLVRGLVRTHDQSLDIANVDIATSNRNGCFQPKQDGMSETKTGKGSCSGQEHTPRSGPL
jgi:hypothetical protein